jgi:hypothetical protein
MNKEFDLQRVIAGDPIEKEVGTTVLFIAYIPTAKANKQLIVQDGDNILMYHANGRYIASSISSPFDLRMKSVAKRIDWAKLPVDTLITLSLDEATANRYFSSFTNDRVYYYRGGLTSRTSGGCLDILTINPSNVQIAPDQPWTVWLGGACPIPDGLEFEYMTHDCPRQVMVGKESASTYLYLWCSKIMYAYRPTGKVLDGYSLC